jgi:hypothetical protein
MALDRTWFNTLVDDDGSGMTGSVWDKADVDALMDAVDAEIARIEPANSVLWTPYFNAQGGGTATYASQRAISARTGKIVTVNGWLSLSAKGSLTGALRLAGFPNAAASLGYPGAHIGITYYAGLVTPLGAISAYFDSGQNLANLVFTGATPGLGTSFVDASHLSNTFSCVFGGSYVID